MSSTHHVGRNNFGGDFQRPLQNLIQDKCPKNDELFDNYRSFAHRHEPTIKDVITDIATSSYPECSRAAALLFRELRFARITLPESAEDLLLQRALSDSPMTWRESAAIALQGTDTQRVIDALLAAATVSAHSNIALMGLRLSPSSTVKDYLQRMQLTARGRLARVCAIEALFTAEASIGDITRLSARMDYGEHIVKAFQEIHRLGLAPDVYIKGLQRALAAVPHHNSNEKYFQRNFPISVLQPFGYVVKMNEFDRRSISSEPGPAEDMPKRLRGVSFYSGPNHKFVGSELTNAQHLISQLVGAYNEIFKDLKRQEPDQTPENLPQLPLLNLPPALGTNNQSQKIAALVAGEPAAQEWLRCLADSFVLKGEPQDVTFAHALLAITDPKAVRETKLYAARLLRVARIYNDDIAAVQRLEDELISIMTNQGLSPYSRHAASIALQRSESAKTISTLCVLLSQADVGDYAVVALRGAKCPNLARYFTGIFKSSNVATRIRGYIAASASGDLMHWRRVSIISQASYLIGTLSDTKLWRWLERVFPALEPTWHSRWFDPELARECSARYSLPSWVRDLIKLRGRKYAAVSQIAAELPCSPDVYGDDRSGLFITDMQLKSGLKKPLLISIFNNPGTGRIAVCNIPGIGSRTITTLNEIPAGLSIPGAFIPWIASTLENLK